MKYQYLISGKNKNTILKYCPLIFKFSRLKDIYLETSITIIIYRVSIVLDKGIFFFFQPKI